MFNIELFYAGEMLNGMFENNPKLSICDDILKDQGLRIFRTQCNKERVMELSKGQADPMRGFAFVIRPQQVLAGLPPDETVILGYFDLVKFLEARNYRQILNW